MRADDGCEGAAPDENCCLGCHPIFPQLIPKPPGRDVGNAAFTLPDFDPGYPFQQHASCAPCLGVRSAF